MKDRFSHLQEVLSEPGVEASSSEAFSTVELDDLPEQAADPDHDPDLDGILQEAQNVRQEIQQIQHDIGLLKEQNYRVLNNASYTGDMERDSNAIGVDIKHRGEAVLQQLHRMNTLSRELEAQRGSTDPVVRIAQTQYMCLSNSFRDVMFNYNETEMSHRENCKRQIQRQMEIVDREVTAEELEEIMESGQLNMFNTSVQADGKTAHSALTQIASRHKDMLELEKRILGIQELFLDVAVLTEEQGSVINNIQIKVQNADTAIKDSRVQLENAQSYNKNNPIKRLFCCCFPCLN